MELHYGTLLQAISSAFGPRLKTAVLFGWGARDEIASSHIIHDWADTDFR